MGRTLRKCTTQHSLVTSGIKLKVPELAPPLAPSDHHQTTKALRVLSVALLHSEMKKKKKSPKRARATAPEEATALDFSLRNGNRRGCPYPDPQANVSPKHQGDPGVGASGLSPP